MGPFEGIKKAHRVMGPGAYVGQPSQVIHPSQEPIYLAGGVVVSDV
jgi:hypothetical protein